MNRRHHQRSERRVDEFASLFRDLEALAEQRLRGRRAEAHERVRPDERDFGFQPGTARADFAGVRLRVDATLTARLPFEVFDDVGDVDGFAIDAGLFQRSIEQLARGSDEGMAGQILRVARLLADQHQRWRASALHRRRSACRACRGRTLCSRRPRRRRFSASVCPAADRERARRVSALRADSGVFSRHVELLDRPTRRARRRAGRRRFPRDCPSSGAAAAGSPLFPIATARLRRSRFTPARFIALPFNSDRSSSSDRFHKSSSCGVVQSGTRLPRCDLCSSRCPARCSMDTLPGRCRIRTRAADSVAMLFRDRAFELDRQIRQAARRVEHTGIDQRTCRTGLETPRARATLIEAGRVRLQRQAADDLGQKDPGTRDLR